MHSKKISIESHSLAKQHGKQLKHMELNLFSEIIDKCRGMEKFKVLYLHGNGEPLLNPHIVKMVEMARNLDIAEQVILVTNGVLLDRAMFRELSAAGVTSVRVSLDVISPRKYREVKGADLVAKVLANIDSCIDLVKEGCASASLTILCVNPESKEYKEETVGILEYFEPKIRNLPNVHIQYRELFNWVSSINRISAGGGYRRAVPCEQPFYLLMVHSDGDISMCCADTTKELILGNIKNSMRLQDVVECGKLNVARRGLLKQDYEMIPACEYCEVYSAVDQVLLKKHTELLGLLRE